MSSLLIKESRSYDDMNYQIIDLFFQILLTTTDTRGYFSEDTFNHYPAVILCDDVFEGFVGAGCSRTKNCVGDDLGK